MWSRRKEEEYRPKQTETPVRPADPPKEAIPMSSMPTRMAEPESFRPSSTASIGKSVVIKGQIISREDLYLDGELEGTVEVQEHRLTIGPNGRVHANLKAREIVAIGAIQGNVEATEKVEIRKEAKLVGDIRTARVVIEDGAFFKGSIDIVRQDAGKSQAQAAAARPQPQPVQAASAAASTGASQVTEFKR